MRENEIISKPEMDGPTGGGVSRSVSGWPRETGHVGGVPVWEILTILEESVENYGVG